ncbi:hypothetical protein PAAG_05655 [Paracoccidioides lutzii Pb01]|uniref:SnoaL-like domain-containing protein n=1 Tax=Paracoccidioides lutzii (strain ATCC MYA-826 / Pb01) TaxID=502779 RepID=C1H4G2_PARBA|nr:hypothetical protein PAAG_05655 [Paracoccidioides lutzii Pb01]EEH34606.1 hypothetical protein PAAG_05655 [Paracoccidioides lutzii Pb01]
MDYLLDRTNIHDVVTKLSFYLDTYQWDKLIDEVFIPNDLIIDYTPSLANEAIVTTATRTVGQWKGLMDGMDTAQHIPSALLISLPQPGPETDVPQTASVTCNVTVTLVRKDAEGGPQLSNGVRALIASHDYLSSLLSFIRAVTVFPLYLYLYFSFLFLYFPLFGDGTLRDIDADMKPPGRRYQGRYDIDLKRVSEGGSSGNPWRITRLKAKISWFSGNKKLLGLED